MVDERYYQVAPPRERLAIAARDCIYADFIQHCRPTPDTRILDVGVSDVVNDVSNVLERKYPHPDRITALGLGQGSAFYAVFPEVAYRRIESNQPLPFADKAFDIAVSNAVLEHVGSEQHQVHCVSELALVANKIFITVPIGIFRSSTTPASGCCTSGKAHSNWRAAASTRRNGLTSGTSF